MSSVETQRPRGCRGRWAVLCGWDQSQSIVTSVTPPPAGVPPTPAVRDVILLSAATRVRRGGHEIGRLAGVDINVSDRSLVEVFSRGHWWSRRTSLPAAAIDCSTPGEIRVTASGDTQAA